jgi:hypothetical protein
MSTRGCGAEGSSRSIVTPTARTHRTGRTRHEPVARGAVGLRFFRGLRAQSNEDGRTTAQASQAVDTLERGPERNARPEDKRAAGVIAHPGLAPAARRSRSCIGAALGMPCCLFSLHLDSRSRAKAIFVYRDRSVVGVPTRVDSGFVGDADHLPGSPNGRTSRLPLSGRRAAVESVSYRATKASGREAANISARGQRSLSGHLEILSGLQAHSGLHR